MLPKKNLQLSEVCSQLLVWMLLGSTSFRRELSQQYLPAECTASKCYNTDFSHYVYVGWVMLTHADLCAVYQGFLLFFTQANAYPFLIGLNMLDNATPSWPSPSVSLLPSSSSQPHHGDYNHTFKDIHATPNLTLTCWVIEVDDWRRLDTFIKCQRHIVFRNSLIRAMFANLAAYCEESKRPAKVKAIMETLVPKY